LAFAGIARQAELIRAGEVSSRELVELYLERIARLDPQLNSYRVVFAERALAEADQADARRRSGDERPLLGVPVAVKGHVDGGSGAAVAAGLAAGALATDGGGSIRIPAACCGLFGLKPQRGRVSLMPDAEHWHGLSVSGCLTRRVIDSALWLDAVAGRAPGDA